MVLTENWPFLHVFILGNKVQENVFYNILEGKNACLGYKNKMFRNSKNWDFSKGVSPWFWSKIGHFCMFFFFVGILGQENVFDDILEGKNACLGYKKKMFRNSKNWDFSKGGSPWFWSTVGDFCMFLF